MTDMVAGNKPAFAHNGELSGRFKEMIRETFGGSGGRHSMEVTTLGLR